MTKNKHQKKSDDNDGSYLFKLVLTLVCGFVWVKLSINHSINLPLPVGFVVGLYYCAKDRSKTDRKITYAVLLVAMLVGFWSGLGLYLQI